jgi:hypothetical protein
MLIVAFIYTYNNSGEQAVEDNIAITDVRRDTSYHNFWGG